MAGDQQWTAQLTLARKSQLAGDMHDPIGAIDLAEAAARLATHGTRIGAAGAAYKAHGTRVRRRCCLVHADSR